MLLSEYARESDTTALVVARRALDLMIDSMAAARDDPPRLVRAALLRGLAKAWIVTAEERYRDAGRALARTLARELRDPGGGSGAVFADQEAYIIEAVLLAAGTFGDATAERRARAALDALLQRTYARGWGVRHAVAGSVQRLLQDQVQVAGACIAAYQGGSDPRYLEIARDIAAVLESNYSDPLGGYYDVAAAPASAPEPHASPAPAPLPVPAALGDRTKQVLDDMLPGANAWAARVLLRLAEATGDAAYRRRAEAALEAVAGAVTGTGIRAATFLGTAREVLASRTP